MQPQAAWHPVSLLWWCRSRGGSPCWWSQCSIGIPAMVAQPCSPVTPASVVQKTGLRLQWHQDLSSGGRVQSDTAPQARLHKHLTCVTRSCFRKDKVCCYPSSKPTQTHTHKRAHTVHPLCGLVHNVPWLLQFFCLWLLRFLFSLFFHVFHVKNQPSGRRPSLCLTQQPGVSRCLCLLSPAVSFSLVIHKKIYI